MDTGLVEADGLNDKTVTLGVTFLLCEYTQTERERELLWTFIIFTFPYLCLQRSPEGQKAKVQNTATV